MDNITSNEFYNRHFNISKKILLSTGYRGEDINHISADIAQPCLYELTMFDIDNSVKENFLSLILRVFCNKTTKQSNDLIALMVKRDSNITCGLYTKDVAETKVIHINDFAQKNGYNLQLTIIRKNNLS